MMLNIFSGKYFDKSNLHLFGQTDYKTYQKQKVDLAEKKRRARARNRARSRFDRDLSKVQIDASIGKVPFKQNELYLPPQPS